MTQPEDTAQPTAPAQHDGETRQQTTGADPAPPDTVSEPPPAPEPDATEPPEGAEPAKRRRGRKPAGEPAAPQGKPLTPLEAFAAIAARGGVFRCKDKGGVVATNFLRPERGLILAREFGPGGVPVVLPSALHGMQRVLGHPVEGASK